jgi:regulator of sigma E protease
VGIPLIAAIGVYGWVVGILGLGLVIFVHELGHFLVAKACGVKCEKFYLGFDINGWRLCRFQWGETEYGIGVLPLGGYVKMLGQDDNPANAAQERERSKLQQSHATAVKHPGDLPHEPTSDEPVALDPRSYMAKSVPQRMAIISAGVIMNLIFAVIFAAIAYRFGVQYVPAIIGDATPGDPAWVQAIRPGDQIVGFDSEPPSEFLRYDRDLVPNVILFTGAGRTLEMEIRPHGSSEIKKLAVKPTEAHDHAVIGVLSPTSTTLISKDPLIEGSAAEQAKVVHTGQDQSAPHDSNGGKEIAKLQAETSAFQAGDRIMYVRRLGNNGVKLRVWNEDQEPSSARLREFLAKFPDEKLDFYVERSDPKDPNAKPTEVQVSVDPNPMRHLGVTMEMGPITAIQQQGLRPEQSPAERAGFKIGDVIVSVAGEGNPDPLRLPELLRRQTGKEIVIEVRRKTDGSEQTVPLKVTPREPADYQMVHVEDHPWSADELGIAYSVSSRIVSVDKGGPADGKLQPGDEIVGVAFPAESDAERAAREKAILPAKPISFEADRWNWPLVFTTIQRAKAGTKVELTFKRDGKQQSAIVETANASDWFNPDRGFYLETLLRTRQVDSWSEAFALGFRETKESVMQVVATVRKLVRGELSLSGTAGPVGIAGAAAASASEGITQLLIFLTFLSANLAVLNFLPIPVLDGGHMMFLIYEGIRGKPASERTMSILTYLGLVFILMLMVFVIGLDITRLFK